MMSSTDWSLTNWSQVEAGFIGAVRLGILVCRDLKARFRYTESGIVKSVANCLSLSRCTNTIFTCIGEAHVQNLVEIGVIVMYRFRLFHRFNSVVRRPILFEQKRANLYDIGAGW